ncbi:MAG: hypothetical protein CSA49_06780 [Gammaproteobacteria bacterium]|nr:MAG: hypothetical protein CSA49_06780 [Gammaproteobacteria bacterium]
MNNQMRPALLALIVSSALAGCGQKGPLYMPASTAEQNAAQPEEQNCPTQRCQAKQPAAPATK